MIKFKYPKDHHIDLAVFIATWIIWVEKYHSPADWRTFCFPRRNAAQILRKSLDQGLEGCLDILCRLLSEAPNTMQATNEFMDDNKVYLSTCEASSPSGNPCAGALLTHQALDFWDSLSNQAQEQAVQSAKNLHRLFETLK